MSSNAKRYIFLRQRRHSDPYRVLILLALLLVGLFVLREFKAGAIEAPFTATATPTRTVISYEQEAETYFQIGDLNKAIGSYQQAIAQQPQDAQLYAELARIQTYSSSLLTNSDARRQRLQEALDSIGKAVELAPDDSTAHAVRAFVLDWNANPILAGDQSAVILLQAEQEAVTAINLDNTNTLALAYYAEILVDQQKWNQAEQYIDQALERDSTLMDVHRVKGYVLESTRQYRLAIEEYQKALEIAPNMPLLWLQIGYNYRALADPSVPAQFDPALEAFSKVVEINERLGIQDSLPYTQIAKTYAQMGEGLISSRNARKALQISPTSPDMYGQLGVIYFQARNYEGAIPAFQCALEGCDAVTSCDVRQCDSETDPAVTVTGLPLSDSTVVYYYTYGSVLAGMARKSNGYCNKAMEILNKVRNAYSEDTIILSIIQPSVEICQSILSETDQTPTTQPQTDQTPTVQPQTGPTQPGNLPTETPSGG
ncbi:protein containg tetratricopeptide repeat [Longilinea arvoryzae]|uniref:Protein containg tetratricopeptide repeat n=1 Tax=Longilinea arvoryzae TaxID=360412 RepID=A0A0S7BG86_9CHLR|nr:tetratricopeptide repeat protein [Longilinea arvoryzae]GAP14036.1 protein containg tetratricopeptide repeat [Longilinea arvoryzae]